MAKEYDINDAFISPESSLAEKGTLGMLGAALLGRQMVAKGINTLGFGNVEGSYASNPKPQQYLDDVFTAAGGKRRNVPMQILKSLNPASLPVELVAAQKSLELTEKRMSILKSQGARIPKALKDYHMNLQAMLPERQMAQGILQRSLNQPIPFEHGGKFIEGGFPQEDKYIRKALERKGLNVNMPIPQFDVSNDKFMIKKLRAAASGDPRLRLINNLLKRNLVKEAKTAAKHGLMEYKGEIVKSGAGEVSLIKDGNKWVTKYTPHYVQRGGLLAPVKEYVIGGHSQMTTFKQYKGHMGFHKSKTRVFDITSYSSAGEKGQSLLQKARIKIAGGLGQALNIHTPVVTTAKYTHKPFGGRKKGSIDKKVRKGRKFVESGAQTYTLAFEKARKLGWGALKFTLTKGKKF